MSEPATPRAALEALIGGDAFTRVNPPILMPADPYFDLAGEEFRRRLLLTTGMDGKEYCLRPDFTLPIAQNYLANGHQPAAYSYLGPLFRQRSDGPAEFEQAGLELIAQPDPDAALDSVLQFARDALAIYGVDTPKIRIGSVAMFEAALADVHMPDVWRPRIRHHFGHSESLLPLLDRLSDPHGAAGNIRARPIVEIEAEISDQMYAAGLPIRSGRTPAEIAARFTEKQALAAAYVPGETIALLRDYLAVSGPVDQALAEIVALFDQVPTALFEAMAQIARHAGEFARRVPGARLVFDAGFAPRLDYYTGIVFEISGTSGAVLASGGEYNRLMQRLGATNEIAASGCALWVERLESEAGQ